MVAIHGASLLARGTAAGTEAANVSLLPTFVGATTPFAILATLFWFARIYSRMVPSIRLHWDDYLITLSWALCMTTWGVGLGLEQVTGARHIQFISIPVIEKGLLYYFATQYFTMYANLLIKASICAMLLRIMQTKTWRVGLWSTLASIAVMTIAVTLTNTLECSPVTAFWTIEERLTHCWDEVTVTNVAMVISAYFVLTDFILALLPLVFIRQLKRSRRDKIVLALLMGCGLLATAAGIVKMFYTHRAAHIVDFFYEGVTLAIFSLLELFIGIIACCAPCLKSLWDKSLRRMGFELSKTNTQQRSTRFGSRSAQNGVKLSSYSSRAAAEVWDGDPGLKSVTDASASATYLSPDEKDVIVKGSYVTWESTPA